MRLTTTLLTAWLLLPLAAQTATAQSLFGTDRGVQRADGPAGEPVFETWDAAFLDGKRAGSVHTTVEKQQQNGRTVYKTAVDLHLKVKRFNTVVEPRMIIGQEETADGKVVGVFTRHYLGKDKKLELSGKVEGKQLKLFRDGTTPLFPAPWNDEVIGLYKQQTLYKDKNVKPGDEFSYLSFEPSINLVVRTDVKVKGYEEVEMPDGKLKQKLLRVEATPEKVEGVQLPTLSVWLNDELEPVRSEFMAPGLGNVTLYRTTKEGAEATGSIASLTDIGVGQQIRLAQGIRNPYDATAAVYRVRVKGDDDPASAFAQGERQQANKVEGDTFLLHVQAGRGPGAGEPAGKIGDEFLQSSYFINCADPQVRKLATQAVAGERDPWRKALRIEKWLRLNMNGRQHESMATADHVARTLEGDCSEYAMLMTAMCRAEGIPARTAIGLIYADTPRGPVFSFHMWTEVGIGDKWVPLDATLGRGFVGATHLKITDHSWHETQSLTPLLPLIRVLNKLSVEVVRVGEA